MYTQLKIKKEYRDKLARLADSQNRSMANMVEVLIDQADAKGINLGLERPDAKKR